VASARVAAVGVVVAGFSNGVNVANLGPAAHAVADHFSVRYGAIGIATTALLLTHTGIQILAGPVIDRIGPRVLGRGALVTSGIANVGMTLVPTFAALLALRALAGLGTGVVFIASLHSARALGGRRLISLFGGSVTLGAAAVLAIGPLIVAHGWWTPFALTAGVSLVALALMPDVGPLPAEGRRDALLSVRGSPELRRLAVLHAATFGSSLVAGVWLLQVLEQRDALSATAAGVVSGGALLTTSIGRPVGGYLQISFARLRWLTAAALAAGAALVGSGSPAPAAAGAIVLGLGFALPFARIYELGTAAHPSSEGAASAFLSASGSAVALAVTPLVGVDVQAHDGAISLVALAAVGVLAATVARVRGQPFSTEPLPG
jgi:nitrate/nitrite transporter NarK